MFVFGLQKITENIPTYIHTYLFYVLEYILRSELKPSNSLRKSLEIQTKYSMSALFIYVALKEYPWILSSDCDLDRK